MKYETNYCPEHGEVSVFDSYCKECGKKLIHHPAPFCKRCNRFIADPRGEVGTHFAFCGGCGQPFEKAVNSKPWWKFWK